MCTSHISFPEFSLATIFFMSGEYLVDHSGFFDLVWVVLCGTHISLFNSVSLCNVVRRDVFGAKTSSHIGFPEFFLPPISIFFLNSGIFLISRVFSCLGLQRRSNSHDKC